MRWPWWLAVAVLATACVATTGRPTFLPYPEAEHVEIGFDLADEDTTVFRVTDSLAARLRADSIPVLRVKRVDGYLETGWFDAKTLRPTSRRPLGADVVKVRGWVDPTQPGFTKVEVETVYVPKADPSVPERELEQPVPSDHPVNKRVADLLKELGERYGIPKDRQEPAAAPTPTRERGTTVDTGQQARPAAVNPRRPSPAPPPPPPPPPPPVPTDSTAPPPSGTAG